MVKNETDISYKDEEETANETFYGHYDNRNPRFSVRHGKGHNKNATCFTDKNVNTIAPQGKTTKCFTCGCKFHWACDCPYTEDNRHKKETSDDTDYLLVSNIVLMSQQKWEASTLMFLGEILGSTILDSGASGTVCGLKWYKCFLETIPEKQRKNIKVQDGVRTYKFGDGNSLKSIHSVILLCIIAGMKISISTDIVDSDILLLLSKNAMKRAKTHINFENNTVTMLGRKVPMQCTSSSHYQIPISRPLLDRGKFKQIFFLLKRLQIRKE